jgi:hypothetical protein
MSIALEAWRLRQEARGAWAAGDFARMADFAADAEKQQATAAGKALLRLGTWLANTPSGS